MPGGVDIRVLVARLSPHGETVSYTGTYQPLAYLVPGFAGAVGPSPSRGLYLARALNALVALALVAGALVVFADTTARRLGAVVALTPMALFCFATFTPSGAEIAAAFAHIAALLALRRERRGAMAVYVASAIVLVSARSLGPVWLVLFDGMFVLTVGWRRALALARAHRLALAAVAAAVLFAVGWQVFVQPSPSSHRVDVADFVVRALSDLPNQFRQHVGVVGWLDTPLPWFAYWAWIVPLAVLAVRARRAAGLLVLAAGATVASTVAVAVAVAYPIDNASQGRWTLPIAMVVPLLAGDSPGPCGGGYRWQRPSPRSTSSRSSSRRAATPSAPTGR